MWGQQSHQLTVGEQAGRQLCFYIPLPSNPGEKAGTWVSMIHSCRAALV